MYTRLIKTITSGTSKARSDIYIDRRAKEYIVRHYTAKGVYMGSKMDVHMDSLAGAIKTGQMFVDN